MAARTPGYEKHAKGEITRVSAPGLCADIIPSGLFTVSLDGLSERGATRSLCS